MDQTSLPLRAAPATWTGVLSGLLGVLTHEVTGRPIGTWVHRLLPHGALVSMKLTPDKRRVLRVAREKRPETPAAWAAWGREVQTFLRHFGAEHWQPTPAEPASGVAARFLELFSGETAPGTARCPVCQAEIPFDLIQGPATRCDHSGGAVVSPLA